MNVETNTKNAENTIQIKQLIPQSGDDKFALSENDELSFKEMLDKFDDESFKNFNSQDFINFAYTDFSEVSNIDLSTISKEDAQFFVDLVGNSKFITKNLAPSEKLGLYKLDEVVRSYKTQKVTSVLMEKLEKMHKENKPLRLDFDNNMSVILKTTKDGLVSAEFIPGDKAVEQYLRNNLQFLRQKFQENDIAYNDLYYRQQEQNQNKKKKNNKGE